MELRCLEHVFQGSILGVISGDTRGSMTPLPMKCQTSMRPATWSVSWLDGRDSPSSGGTSQQSALKWMGMPSPNFRIPGPSLYPELGIYMVPNSGYLGPNRG